MTLRELVQPISVMAAAAAACTWAPAARADDEAPRRTRITLGPQLAPSFPGSDGLSVRPFFDFARTRGTDPFPFDAPDESFGFIAWSNGGFAVGPLFHDACEPTNARYGFAQCR